VGRPPPAGSPSPLRRTWSRPSPRDTFRVRNLPNLPSYVNRFLHLQEAVAPAQNPSFRQRQYNHRKLHLFPNGDPQVCPPHRPPLAWSSRARWASFPGAQRRLFSPSLPYLRLPSWHLYESAHSPAPQAPQEPRPKSLPPSPKGPSPTPDGHAKPSPHGPRILPKAPIKIRITHLLRLSRRRRRPVFWGFAKPAAAAGLTTPRHLRGAAGSNGTPATAWVSPADSSLEAAGGPRVRVSGSLRGNQPAGGAARHTGTCWSSGGCPAIGAGSDPPEPMT